MNTLEAIHTRHSISKILPEPLPRAVIEQLLDAAVQAPNHHRVRPWRFAVLRGAAREQLGHVMAQSLLTSQPDSSENALEKEHARPLRAPVLIAIAVDPPAEEKVVEVENICAAAAAAQNLLLAAHALGLAAIWRTGPAAYSAQVKQFLGFTPQHHLIAIIYLGYPDPAAPAPLARPSFEDRTVWME